MSNEFYVLANIAPPPNIATDSSASLLAQTPSLEGSSPRKWHLVPTSLNSWIMYRELHAAMLGRVWRQMGRCWNACLSNGFQGTWDPAALGRGRDSPGKEEGQTTAQRPGHGRYKMDLLEHSHGSKCTLNAPAASQREVMGPRHSEFSSCPHNLKVLKLICTNQAGRKPRNTYCYSKEE